MSCIFSKSRKAALVDMINRGYMDKYHNILDLNGFRKRTAFLTEYAKNTYGVDNGRVFSETDSGRKAVPNTEAFTAIDSAKDNYMKKRYNNTGIIGFIKQTESDIEPSKIC
jgi:hypothetical protein